MPLPSEEEEEERAVCFVRDLSARSAQCSFSAAAAVIGVKTCRVRER